MPGVFKVIRVREETHLLVKRDAEANRRDIGPHADLLLLEALLARHGGQRESPAWASARAGEQDAPPPRPESPGE